jgi:hypothetical protein
MMVYRDITFLAAGPQGTQAKDDVGVVTGKSTYSEKVPNVGMCPLLFGCGR